jgi:hypothetical protein
MLTLPMTSWVAGRPSYLRSVRAATLFLVGAARLCLSQDAPHSESVRLAFECGKVAETASAYLQRHGMANSVNPRLPGLSIGAGQKWTDARGNEISAFKVYWTYANRKDTEKQPVASWRLGLSRYTPRGAMKLVPDEGGCKVEFQLRFETSGADMVAILIPLDSSWSYGSNGRLEREYMGGIAAELGRPELAAPKP